ncbi:MAG: type II toxin-antitoxin system RelE/ParE family toxin [Aquificae bacterium]|nr:type II toxin-antitoxin system RelE/ParE family toxin [Aquificota bacterium]
MNWTIKLSSVAEKKYKKLDKNTKRRIKEALIELAQSENPKLHRHTKPLTGPLRGFYRLRVGDFRIIFSLITDEKVIAVVNIAPRGEAYK